MHICLNPYCIGSSNHAQNKMAAAPVEMSLNPYCIGSSNHAEFQRDMNALWNEVLILIVLDHLIMQQQGRRIAEHQHCLNPYCIGSSNHAAAK